jgi:hypothetical protein
MLAFQFIETTGTRIQESPVGDVAAKGFIEAFVYTM